MKGKATAASMIALMVLGGCSTNTGGSSPAPGPTTLYGPPASLAVHEENMLKRAIVARLKDPDSARFSSEFKASRSPNGDLNVCGMVNARNSFGGYTGDLPFLARISRGEVAELGIATPQHASVILTVCRRLGVPI